MKNRICKISLISLIAVCSVNMPAGARVNIKSNSNRSYADAYNQVAAIRYQQDYMDALETNVTTASDTGDLPVMVEDKKLAESIKNNTAQNVHMADLEACSMIYPNGVFRWGIPDSGVRRNQTQQCVAVVELRDAKNGAVLATTTVAAGDMMKCNIEMFPQSGWMNALNSVVLPADEPPTLADVESVMNAEQKQNAGFKIAAGAILGAVSGNLLAPKAAGNSGVVNTSKTGIADTAIGAIAGGGIMAASTYSGKVAGDTIKSTAVNAASGMVVGNMMAGLTGEDSVLSTTKCVVDKSEKDCIVGTIKTQDNTLNFDKWLAKQAEGKTKEIVEGQENKSVPKYPNPAALISRDSATVMLCNNNSGIFEDCAPITHNLVNVSVYTKTTSVELKKAGSDTIAHELKIYTKLNNSNDYEETTEASDGTPRFYRIQSASIVTGTPRHAYAVFDNLPTKPLGYTDKDWASLESRATYYYRNNDGSVSGLVPVNENETLIFEPRVKNATDGDIVDMSNAARAKATMIGTAAGGAMGGFAGYQGAKTEIEERWVAAKREYDDSLTNFVCMTGGRYLAPYNSYLDIPEYKKPEQ